MADTDVRSQKSNRPRIEEDASKRLSYQATPPYWLRNRSATHSTIRSLETPAAITLKDNTEEEAEAHNQLWARSITVDHFVTIQGNSVGIGAYVVWICKVEMLDGNPMTIHKRYSEFDELRDRLLKAFPDSTNTSLPPLPPKSAIYKFKLKFLEKRRQGLAYFLNCVMLSPQYASSIIIKDFIFDQSNVYIS